MKKKYFCLLLMCASLALPVLATAQEAPPPETATKTPAKPAREPFKIAHVTNEQVSTLRNLRPGAKMLVYLGASTEALTADAAAFRALQQWVEAGGVMAVYSDAASLFGFSLQPARLGNPQQGGQLFGRAEAAIPFGSEPLLWNMPAAAPGSADEDLPLLDEAPRRRRRNARLSVPDPSDFGSMTIFYDLEEGDSLLVSHPTAVPLMRVTDLAQPQTNLYSSAVACYGNGWIIFMPRHVEAERAQGEQFLTNLSAMAANPPLPISVSALTTTAESLHGDTPNYAPLLTELQNRLIGKATPAAAGENGQEAEDADNDNNAAEDNNGDDETNAENIIESAASANTTQLMPAALPVSRSLAISMMNAMKAATTASPPENASERVASVVALWMLRASIQHVVPPIDDEAADPAEADANITQWLEEATELAPEAREVLFWQGVFHAQIAANRLLPAPQRAAAYAAAATAWNQAANAPPLLVTPTTVTAPVPQEEDNGEEDDDDAAAAAPRPPLGAGFGDPTPALLADWAKQAQQAATVTAIEPPVTQLVGGVILRHVENDPTLRLALPTIEKLQSMAGQIGWLAPQEEVLIFPNEAALEAYATRLGPLEPGETPLASSFGSYGRVLGKRILMVSQPSQPIIIPGTPPRIIQAGTAAAAIIGRLHGELLFDVLDEGGNHTPGWMRLGLMIMASKAVTAEGDTNQQSAQQLLEAGAANQLLTPDDFEERGGQNDNQSGLSEAQAESLMMYFYQVFGPGAVMETAQRLGSGQEIDEALDATTEMTEEEFFASWFEALQGNNDMP